MITLDPDTAERNSAILSKITEAHHRKAGVYAAVLVEGVIRVGDSIEVAN
jgi:MOSC domain-containing protein YiiM